MKLTVLGKFGPYPSRFGGACSGYLVEGEETKLLLDMGPGILGQLQKKVDIRELNAIYLSHLHYDHTSDLLAFRYLLEDLNMHMKIFAPVDDTPWCKILLNHHLFDVVDLNKTPKFTIGEFECFVHLMRHPVTNFGVRIGYEGRVLAYTGDTASGGVDLLRFVKDADLALGDFSKPVGFKGYHMTVEQAEILAEKTGVKLLATHVSPFAPPDEYFKYNSQIDVAEIDKVYLI
jgi:ribonuclease BN (tRNA processing enzyme)